MAVRSGRRDVVRRKRNKPCRVSADAAFTCRRASVRVQGAEGDGWRHAPQPVRLLWLLHQWDFLRLCRMRPPAVHQRGEAPHGGGQGGHSGTPVTVSASVDVQLCPDGAELQVGEGDRRQGGHAIAPEPSLLLGARRQVNRRHRCRGGFRAGLVTASSASLPRLRLIYFGGYGPKTLSQNTSSPSFTVEEMTWVSE